MEWQVFLNRLTTESSTIGLLKEFSLINDDVQRLTFCAENSFINSSLDRWLLKNTPLPLIKCLQRTLKFKKSADSAFFQHLDDKAIQLYGKALKISPRSEISVLFGNRSAVLFSKGLWEHCLVDIECALKEGFSPTKQWRLYKRKGNALMKLKRYSESLLSFKTCLTLLPTDLSDERNVVEALTKSACKTDLNSTVDAIKVDSEQNNFHPVNGFDKILIKGSSSLGIGCDSMQGRYIFAKEDISCGSIIISEKPYAAVLLPPWYKTHCQHCFDKVELLFPCYECAEVVFCSPLCYSNAWAVYHRFECKKLTLMEKIGIAHLSLRIVLVSEASDLLKFSCSEYINTNSKFMGTSSKVDGFNEQGVYQADYESVYFLLTHSKCFPIEDLFQYSVAGLLLYKLLLETDYFNFHSKLQQRQLGVGSLLLRHIQQLICNAHAVTCLNAGNCSSANIIEQDQVRIATAIYPTTSLLNHSCEPTILNSFHKNQLIVKVVRDVRKGEQIYNCYGPHYRRMDYEDRRTVLWQQYFFTCSCAHCVNQQSHADSDCFICFKCKQPFTDKKNCINCGADFLKDTYISKANRCDELFMDAMRVLSVSSGNNSIEKALKIFLECSILQEQIYVAHHYLLSRSYDIIGKCYAMLSNYKAALDFVKKSICIVKMRYGDQSIEYTNEILKLTDIFMHVVDGGENVHVKEALDYVNQGLTLVRINKQPGCSDIIDLERKLDILKSIDKILLLDYVR